MHVVLFIIVFLGILWLGFAWPEKEVETDTGNKYDPRTYALLEISSTAALMHAHIRVKKTVCDFPKVMSVEQETAVFIMLDKNLRKECEEAAWCDETRGREVPAEIIRGIVEKQRIEQTARCKLVDLVYNLSFPVYENILTSQTLPTDAYIFSQLETDMDSEDWHEVSIGLFPDFSTCERIRMMFNDKGFRTEKCQLWTESITRLPPG